ncbi:MAG: class A beta-lactamase-related serine hydrolase [Phenylobacterium sp.]|nr:MAG: class A beta-lactamase-related serine hydrolase [Phenylobacterium sp.]
MHQLTRRTALAVGAAAFGAPRAFARSSGLSPEGLAGAKAVTEAAVANGDVPGVVSLIWRRGEIVQLNTVGFRNIERRLPMERSTIFRIASMSKPITVAAALMLVEDGRIRLSDPITRWAPEFAQMRVLRRADGPLDDTYPAPRVITIEDLMTHRSGLSYSFLAQGPLAGALQAKVGMGLESSLSPDAWMKTMAALPLAYAPGERFNYGHSIDVLGFIVGRAAGTSLRQVLMERMFGPLGMTDTDFWVPPDKRDRLVTPYLSPSPGHFAPLPTPSFVGAGPPAYTSGGQGLVSTVDDYLTFARLLVGKGEVNGKRLLRPQSVRLMTTDHLTAAQRQIPTFVANWKTQGFGLGMSVVRDPKAYAAAGQGAGSAGAFGWPGLFGGWWQGDPAQDMITIWLPEVLPGAPGKDGKLPRLPGMKAAAEFQTRAYEGLAV